MSKPKQASKINWPLTERAKQKKLQRQMDAVNKALPAVQAAAAIASIPIDHKDRFTAQIREELKNGRLEAGTLEAEEGKTDYLQSNAAWDEVAIISDDCAQLLRAAALFTPALRSPELMALVDDRTLLIRNVKSITRDTNTLMVELNKIRDTHSQKSGAAVTPEDLVLSCSVFTDYVNFMDRHSASVMPTSLWISEQIQEAIDKLRAINPELAASLSAQVLGRMQEINVAVQEVTGGRSDYPTDVVVKHETVAETNV